MQRLRLLKVLVGHGLYLRRRAARQAGALHPVLPEWVHPAADLSLHLRYPRGRHLLVQGAGDRVIGEWQLPGPLGRHLLSMLAAEHARAIGHDELAEEIWQGAPPPAWATSLKALVSRTRAAITVAGFDGGSLITGAPGVYRFMLPPSGWVDIDAAKSAAHEAEGKLAGGDLIRSAQQLFVAKLITSRPFPPGMTGQWVERRRADFADLRIRTLQCSASVNLAISSFRAGARDAQRAVDADPLRESSWWLLMNAHAGTGDLASAIAAYERCRSTLARELGSTPSRQHASDTPQSSPEPATTHSRRQARHNVGLRKSRIRQNQSPSPADPAARTAGPSRSSGRYTDLNLASEAALIARLGAGRTTYLRQS